MTSTRVRSESGRSCRKIDFQTCVSVSQFQNRVPAPSFGATVFVSAIGPFSRYQRRISTKDTEDTKVGLPESRSTSCKSPGALCPLCSISLRLQERLGIGPLPELVLE